jgi:hypothetical protein
MIKTHHTAKTEMGKEGKIQSMLFSKAKWTVKKAKAWLSKHGYGNDDIDEKDKHLRFRQVSPSYMESKGYDFITRPFGTSGIQAIIGYKNKDPIDIRKEEREDLMLDKIKQVADDIRDLRAVHGTGVLDKIMDHITGKGIHIDIDSHNAKGVRSSTGEGIHIDIDSHNAKGAHSSTGEGIIERAKKTLGMTTTTKKFTKGSQEVKDHMAKIRSMKKN